MQLKLVSAICIATLIPGLALSADITIDGAISDWDALTYVETETGVGYAGGTYTKYGSTNGATKTVLQGVVDATSGRHTDATIYGYAIAGDGGGMYFAAALTTDTRNRDPGDNPDPNAETAMIPCVALHFGLSMPAFDDVAWRIGLDAQARLEQSEIGDDPAWTMLWYRHSLSDDDAATEPNYVDDVYSSGFVYDAEGNWVGHQSDADMIVGGSGCGFPEGVEQAVAWDPIDHFRVVEYFVPWSAWQAAIDTSLNSVYSLGEVEGPDLSDLEGAEVTFDIWHQRANDAGIAGYDWVLNALSGDLADMSCPVIVSSPPPIEEEPPAEEPPEDTEAPVLTSDVRDITPPEAPITFTVAATDDSGVVDIMVVTESYMVVGGGGLNESSDGANVFVTGTSVTIENSGGVGTVIKIDAIATDAAGNATAETYYVNVLNPGKGSGVE